MATDIPATVKTYHIPDKDVQSAIALSLQDIEKNGLFINT